MRSVERWTKWLSAASLAALVSGCAGMPHDASMPIDDPNEQFNRGVLHLNQVVLDPPATVVKSMPGVIRDRFEDLDANLKEPRVFANDVLQGRLNAAGITVARFVFNTIFGLGGLFDVAATRRIAAADRRFWPDHVRLGRSLGRLYCDPLFRSLDATRFIGGIVDTVGDPVGWVVGGIFLGWPWTIGSGALSAVAHLGQWKQAESSSVDFYTFLRSSYYQTRRNQLREAQGLPPEVESPATAGPVVGAPATLGPGVASPAYAIPPPQ